MRLSLATLLHRGDGEGPLTLENIQAPDTAAGDAQFFVDDWSRPVQLRPVLKSEGLPGREVQRGEWVLVARNVVPELRAFVKLPPHLRKNNGRAIAAAIRKVERVHPPYAEIFRRAIRVRGPVPELLEIQPDGSVRRSPAT